MTAISVVDFHVRVTHAESTDLFVGEPDEPVQLVRVRYVDADGRTGIEVDGDGLRSEAQVPPAGDGTIEIPVRRTTGGGGGRHAVVLAAGKRTPFEFTVAEPGWTMYMVSHFHYDPVWWKPRAPTPACGRKTRPADADRTTPSPWSLLTSKYLKRTRLQIRPGRGRLPEAVFRHPPEDREDLRFIAEGRIEVMGGTYNEPNTNLTGAGRRSGNFVHGIGFQRDILGPIRQPRGSSTYSATTRSSPGWPPTPGLPREFLGAGSASSVGPDAERRRPLRMRFNSEFEWIAPLPRTAHPHMPAHYAAGWWMDSSTSLAQAQRATYELFESLKVVALTRNVLLPSEPTTRRPTRG